MRNLIKAIQLGPLTVLLTHWDHDTTVYMPGYGFRQHDCRSFSLYTGYLHVSFVW